MACALTSVLLFCCYRFHDAGNRCSIESPPPPLFYVVLSFFLVMPGCLLLPHEASVRARAPSSRAQPVARDLPPLAVQGPIVSQATCSTCLASAMTRAIVLPPRRIPSSPAVGGGTSQRGAWRRLPRPSASTAALAAAAAARGCDKAAAAPSAAAAAPHAAAAAPPAAAAAISAAVIYLLI